MEFTHEDYDLQLRCYKSSWGMPHWNLSVRKNDQWLVSRGPFFTIASAIHEGVQYINKYGK
jgi:hypothetical protein